MALANLGRKEEAGHTIGGALARDPHNAHSHANQGWNYLHQGQPDKALEHFREALRIDPELEWAQLGIVEALKARHFVYRQMLRYFLWMSTLSGSAQWGVIIGIYFAQRLLGNLAQARSPWAPYMEVLLWCLIGFVFMTWIAQPLFDVVLRFNRFGRLALSRAQRHKSNWVGSLLALALAGLLAGLAFDRTEGYVLAGISVGLIVPVVGVFHCQAGWPRSVMLLLATVLFTLGISIFVLVVRSALNPRDGRAYLDTAVDCGRFFTYGVLAAAILTNVLAGVRPRR
jgi:tetratricopeptide (TPR) repeat protein